MIIKRLSLLLFGILFVVVSFLMLTSSPPELASRIGFMDKIGHAGAFFILSLLLAVALGRGKGRKLKYILAAAALLALYGILIEYIQQFTGRSPEAGDLIADLIGIALGSFAALFFL